MSYRKASDKWMAIAEGKERDRGRGNCPLCAKHLGCINCPVAADGFGSCRGTPQSMRAKHRWTKECKDNAVWANVIFCPECQLLALNEWLYLKSIGE